MLHYVVYNTTLLIPIVCCCAIVTLHLYTLCYYIINSHSFSFTTAIFISMSGFAIVILHFYTYLNYNLLLLTATPYVLIFWLAIVTFNFYTLLHYQVSLFVAVPYVSIYVFCPLLPRILIHRYIITFTFHCFCCAHYSIHI